MGVRIQYRDRGHGKTRRLAFLGDLQPTLGALLCVCATLILCGPLESSSAGAATAFPTSHTLTLSFLQDPGQPPDPDVFYGSEGLLLTRNVYEGLVQYQPGKANPKIVPDLATSWQISQDGLTYTFQLRHGVVFHDGTQFDSSSIGASFARRSAVDGGPAYMVSDVAKVTAEGPYTVAVTLKAANSAFLSYLASSYGPVMESPTALKLHAGTDDDQTYLQSHDVGTGPYELTKASVGDAYQLAAFPSYWGKKPYYTTVNIPVLDDATSQELQFNDGQIAAILHDLTTSAIKQYQNDKSISFYSLPSFENEGVFVIRIGDSSPAQRTEEPCWKQSTPRRLCKRYSREQGVLRIRPYPTGYFHCLLVNNGLRTIRPPCEHCLPSSILPEEDYRRLRLGSSRRSTCC